MEVKRFNLESDFKKLEDYLRNQYIENKNMTSWLPERLNDLIEISFNIVVNISESLKREIIFEIIAFTYFEYKKILQVIKIFAKKPHR